MIWDFIRDFLVQYIFGGYDSNGVGHYTLVGWLYDAEDGENIDWYSTDFPVIEKIKDGNLYTLSLGDWLSTTTTIIIMCVIVFLFALLVRWIFKAVTSAFLLK